MKLFLIALALFGLVACDEPLKPHLSGNFVHRSTETLSDHETIDIYYDSLNDNICYLHRDYNRLTAQLSCVSRARYLPQ